MFPSIELEKRAAAKSCNEIGTDAPDKFQSHRFPGLPTFLGDQQLRHLDFCFNLVINKLVNKTVKWCNQTLTTVYTDPTFRANPEMTRIRLGYKTIDNYPFSSLQS